jgi:hypothetical protein
LFRQKSSSAALDHRDVKQSPGHDYCAVPEIPVVLPNHVLTSEF